MMPKSFADYNLLAQGYSKLGGVRALSTTSSYNLRTPPRRVRMKQVVVLRRGRAYTFTCASLDATYAKYNAAFNKTLASVRFR